MIIKNTRLKIDLARLKPCIFCGSLDLSRWYPAQYTDDSGEISCGDSKCEIYTTIVGYSMESMIDLWNKLTKERYYYEQNRPSDKELITILYEAHLNPQSSDSLIKNMSYIQDAVHNRPRKA